MKQLRPQIREFIDNAGEAEVLQSGNAWIWMAYSGDIFIAAGDLANTKRYRVLTVEEEQVWDRIFQPIVQS
jgi:spermidine/putrescine-binding protein